jgi:hypothetical protein
MHKFQENISILASLTCVFDAQVNIFLLLLARDLQIVGDALHSAR